MRYLMLLTLLGCSTVPVPTTDGGFLGDAGPVLPDSGSDASALPDTGVDAGLEPVDAAAPVDDAAVVLADAGAPMMDSREVTWGAWRWLTDDAGVSPGTGLGCTAGRGDGYPVNCITVELAEAYCASQGRRLPTRDEWLAEAMLYPAGGEVVGASGPDFTVRGGDGTCYTALCDTHGNLSELTSDGFVMGGNFADAVPGLEERTFTAPDPRVGFRCRAR